MWAVAMSIWVKNFLKITFTVACIIYISIAYSQFV